MDNQELQTFLNIIDGRIKKYINENKVLKQYCGVVEEKVQESLSKYKVRLLGDTTIFTFLNKTGEVLSKGDYVYVQTVGTDLTTGVVMYKTRESAIPEDFIVSQGTTEDGWTYREWNSGIGECWRTIEINTVVSNQYGGIYTSPVGNPTEAIAYPLAFESRPVEHCTCNTGSAGVMTVTANTDENTSQYIIWRGSSKIETIKYQLSISVSGRVSVSGKVEN